MKIKINEKIICIPPYISASWDQVSFVQSEEDPTTKNLILILHLSDGKEIRIPNLDASIIEIAFSQHLKFMEQVSPLVQKQPTKEPVKTFGQMLQQLFGEGITNMPIRFGIAGLPNIEGIEMAFQHNPAAAEAPDMPQEVLEKISQMAKMMLQGDPNGFPKPEPHCNCMHCQVARSLHHIPKKDESLSDEEAVQDEELKFKSWDINQSGDKQYVVSNPLDPKEKYRVFLGNPIGCTCGEAHCEHIKAVLYS